MNKFEKLEELKKKMIMDDTLPLRDGATQLVFGEADTDCEIMCIGEGPGYWEKNKKIKATSI